MVGPRQWGTECTGWRPDYPVVSRIPGFLGAGAPRPLNAWACGLRCTLQFGLASGTGQQMFRQVEQVVVEGLQRWRATLEARAEYQQAGGQQQGQHGGEAQAAGNRAGQLGPPLG